MPKSVIRLKGTLRVVAPLHVGSGDTRHVTQVKGKAGSNRPPEVMAIVRDAAGRPYIPGTTIKGLLRRLCETTFGADSAPVNALMGEIKMDRANESRGRMGAVLVRGATLCGTPPDVRHMPFADAPGTAFVLEQSLGSGVFVSARTRINETSGTALDNKLFHMEMVAEGTEFGFGLVIEVRGKDSLNHSRALRDQLLEALKLLAMPDGVPIGKGQADGLGAVRLMPGTLKVESQTLTASGDFSVQPEMQPWKDEKFEVAPEGENTIHLHCEGPFLVIDSSHIPPPMAANGDSKGRIQAQAQRISDEVPLLLGTSVSGALRSRARWLFGIRALREKSADAIDDPDAVVASPKKASALSPVQQLFGVTGFRGLVSICNLAVIEATPWDVTSVKIDRFSGAPINGALFTTAAFIGVTIRFDLVLDERRTKALGENPAAKALFDELVRDVKRKGLEIGHGANKGFGWFEPAGVKA